MHMQKQICIRLEEKTKSQPKSYPQFSSVTQWCLTLCDPMTTACQASLSITKFRSLLKLMPIRSVKPSNHLIFCHPFLLLPSIFPRIRVFSNESFFTSSGQSIGVSALVSVLSMNIQSLISFRKDWLDLLAI